MKPLILTWMVIFTFGALIAWFWVSMNEIDSKRRQETQKTYEVWSRINPEVKLTFEEWKLLYDQKLLGNRQQK